MFRMDTRSSVTKVLKRFACFCSTVKRRRERKLQKKIMDKFPNYGIVCIGE